MIARILQNLLTILFLLPITIVDIQATSLHGELPVYSRVYDEYRNPYVDGRKALELAKATGRMVLIEVGGDWCRWCHVLERFIRQHPDIENGLHQTFVVLKVNIGEDNDNAEFMSAFPPANGYPHMYISDSEGNILQSRDTAEFRENKQYSRQRFMAFINRWQNRYE